MFDRKTFKYCLLLTVIFPLALCTVLKAQCVSHSLPPIRKPGLPASVAERVVLGRVYQGSYAARTIPDSNSTVAQAFAGLDPSWVSGLFYLQPGAHLKRKQIAVYNAVRNAVLAVNPNAKFGVVISARLYKSPAQVLRDMKNISCAIPVDIWFFDFYTNVFKKRPNVFSPKVIKYAHEHGQYIGGNQFGGFKVPPGTDFLAINDGKFQLDIAKLKALESENKFPFLVHLDNNPQNGSADESCIFKDDLTEMQRASYVTSLAAEQQGGLYKYMYNLFFPECPINRAYDAYRDYPMYTTLRHLMNDYNVPRARAPLSENFGRALVGQRSRLAVLSYSIGGFELPKFTATLKYGKEFQLVSQHPECRNSNATFTCTFEVVFRPNHIGLQTDALVVRNSAGNIYSTTLLYGDAVGAQGQLLRGIEKVIPLGPLASPSGIAVDNSRNIYVSAKGDKEVVELLADDNYAQKTIVRGIASPDGLAVDGAGNLFVSNKSKNTVLDIPTTPYSATLLVGAGFNDSRTVKRPSAVAVDGSGNVYIADSGKNRVVELLADGNQQRIIADHLNDPQGVAVDAKGNVYIADTGANRILEVFSRGGGPVEIGSGFDHPESLAVDSSGYVYVADTGNKRVVRISPDGKAEKNIGKGYQLPTDVAIGPDGSLYVLDAGRNQIIRIDRTRPDRHGFDAKP